MTAPLKRSRPSRSVPLVPTVTSNVSAAAENDDGDDDRTSSSADVKPFIQRRLSSTPGFFASTKQSLTHRKQYTPHTHKSNALHTDTTLTASSDEENSELQREGCTPSDVFSDMLDSERQLQYYRTPCRDSVPCWNWCNENAGIRHYHDHHWGYPVTNKYKMFAYMCYQILMAGLKWDVVNNKLASINEAFCWFDYDLLSQYANNSEYIDELMQNSGIIRDRRKLINIMHNATVCVKLDQTYPGGFVQYLWDFDSKMTVQERLLASGKALPSHMRSHHLSGTAVEAADGVHPTAICSIIDKEFKKIGLKHIGEFKIAEKQRRTMQQFQHEDISQYPKWYKQAMAE